MTYDGFHHYTYDGENRIVAVSGAESASCVCDADGITQLPYGDFQNTTGSCGDPSPMHFHGQVAGRRKRAG